jgi:hypothetical protein
MNDVREAIERVGAHYETRGRGFDDLARRRNRISARRRIRAGGLALMIAAGGSLLAARAFVASTPAPPKVRLPATLPATGAVQAAETNCPTPSGDSPTPVVLSSSSGSPGSRVGVSGTFLSGDLFLQLWWNADGDRIPDKVAAPPWPPTGPDLRFEPAGSGPVVELASVAGPLTADCSFRTRFTVPDVRPGTYQVLWALGAVNAPPGYGLLTSTVTFEVTEER